MWLTFCTLALCFNGIRPSDSESNYGEINFFDGPSSYTVESTVLLNDINRRDKEVSFKLNSTLVVHPVWRGGAREHLLRFELQSPRLLGRGTHVNAEYKELASMWDGYSSTVYYTHSRNGLVNQLYLDLSEPHEVLNYKRSLTSLFQFNYSDDVGNETDASGACEVYYETLSEQVLRKVKHRCSWGEEVEGEVRSRRVTRYSLDAARVPLEVYAEELHELGGALGEGALKARAWMRLRRAPAPRAAPPAPAADLRDALAQLLPPLAPLPLAMVEPSPRPRPAPTVPELEALLKETSEEALDGAGASEGADAAAALVRLLPALRAASSIELGALLRARTNDSERLTGLCYALGLAGTANALVAVEELLRLEDTAAPALRYLQGFTLTATPEGSAVTELLKVSEISPRQDVVEGALLAAAAGASRLPPAAGDVVLDRLLQGLANCQEDECRALRLRALGNLRRADTVDVLLQHAQRGVGSAAAAAIDALDRVPPLALLNATRLRWLERVALGPGPLELRAAAADLALRRYVHAPTSAAPLLGALHRHAPTELRRLVWGRLRALAVEHAPVRELLAALPLRVTGWPARTLPGSSALHVLDVGGGAGWRAVLQMSLLLSGGDLHRGAMSLEMVGPDDLLDETLSVEVYTVGPVTHAGAVFGEELSYDGGKMALTVGGARLRRRSQAELLALARPGLVPLLRALRPLPGARATLPLLGAGVLQLERRGALALDSEVQWSSGSHGVSAHLHVRGALATETKAHVAGAWGELGARSLVSAAPRLRVSAMGGTCVRVHVDRYELGYGVTLRSELGGARRRVWRRREARRPQQGRSVVGGGEACHLLVNEIESTN